MRATFVCATPYDYRNSIFVGDRAAGLGGAYAALSDDLSGMAYNPGGIAFANSNSLSVSTNMFSQNQLDYDKFFGNTNFKFTARSLIPGLIGVVKRVESPFGQLIVFGGAFAAYEENADFSVQAKNGTVQFDGKDVPFNYDGSLSVNAHSQVYGGGAALKLNEALGYGTSFEYETVSINSKNFGDMSFGPMEIPERADTLGVTHNVQSLVRKGEVNFLFWRNGFRWQYENFKLGFSARVGRMVAMNIEGRERHLTYLTKPDGTSFSESELPEKFAKYAHVIHEDEDVKTSMPEHKWSAEYRLGIAHAITPAWLVASDVAYYPLEFGESDSKEYKPVTNISIGTEIKLSDTIRSSAGLFTNFDRKRRSTVDAEANIDYYGGALEFCYDSDDTRYGLSAVYQTGKGKTLGLGNDGVQPTVRGSSFSAALSLTTRK